MRGSLEITPEKSTDNYNSKIPGKNEGHNRNTIRIGVNKNGRAKVCPAASDKNNLSYWALELGIREDIWGLLYPLLPTCSSAFMRLSGWPALSRYYYIASSLPSTPLLLPGQARPRVSSRFSLYQPFPLIAFCLPSVVSS